MHHHLARRIALNLRTCCPADALRKFSPLKITNFHHLSPRKFPLATHNAGQ